jgi:proline dehydrogenase
MLASALRIAFLWLSNRRWLAHLALRIPWLRRLPLRFVAGTTLDEAVAAVRALNGDGAKVTLDVLGESVEDRSAADRAAGEYVRTIERIGAEGLDANVSVKLTQMGLDLGVEPCLEVIRRVVETGERHGVFVRIDMESSAYTDRTLEVMWRLRREGCPVGPVLQAYLHRSVEDARRLASERVPVRVCKGAYAEPEEIAWHDRGAIGRSFLEIVRILLEADAYPAIATHDPEMVRGALALVREHGIAPDRYEFQMLYGIRRDLQQRLIERGHRVRIYVPYGTEWYPYFMRRLAERPANVAFVVRSLFGERR